MNKIAEERDYYKRAYERKCYRLAQERAERRKPDKLLDAVCIMLMGLGGSAFVYAFMDFAKWMMGG